MTPRAWRSCASGVAMAAMLLGVASKARAQERREPRQAPTAATSGDVDAIERALFDASRRAPRDPSARAALGEWLASRGQLKAGAVLLEEARLFGGDANAIAARLAHIYTWLRDWQSLAALPATPLAAGEKVRAAQLADRNTGVSGPDTTVLPFAPLEVGALGRMPLVLGTDTLWGEVDPQEEGIVVPGLGRGAGLVEIVGEDRRGPLGILTECSLGALTLRHIPVRVDASLGVGRARIGFDVFALLAPTVDARAGTVTLRRAGRVEAGADALEVPMLLGFPGVRLSARAGEPFVPMASAAGRAALRGHPWTVDLRRGVIRVEGVR